MQILCLQTGDRDYDSDCNRAITSSLRIRVRIRIRIALGAGVGMQSLCLVHWRSHAPRAPGVRVWVNVRARVGTRVRAEGYIQGSGQGSPAY